jgi:hypothetical protein
MTYAPNGIRDQLMEPIEVGNGLWGWLAQREWRRKDRMGEEERRKKGRRKGRGAIYRARAPASLVPCINHTAPTSLAPLSIGMGVGGGALLPDKGANSDDALHRQHSAKHPPHIEVASGCEGSRRAPIALEPY